MKIYLLICFCLVSGFALAQDASPTPAVIEAIDKATNWVPASIPTWLMGVLVVVVEFLMRAVPSVKPRSILILISSVLVSLAKLFTKASGLLDSVVQNLKDPEKKA